MMSFSHALKRLRSTFTDFIASGGVDRTQMLPSRKRLPLVEALESRQLLSVTVSVAATVPDASEAGLVAGNFRITRAYDGEDNNTAALTVNFTVSGTAVSGTDFTAIGTSVEIPADADYIDVAVTPLDDATAQPAHTVILTVAAGAYTVADAPADTATVTIEDNDATEITVATPDATAAEDSTDTGHFVITRTGPTDSDLLVNLAITGTASNITDYEEVPRIITIPAGSSTADVWIVQNDDTAVEGSETAILTVIAGTGYALGGTVTGTVTIADNDKVVLSVAGSDATAAEAAVISDTGKFTITRTGSTKGVLTVHYTISGTATGSAAASAASSDHDYNNTLLTGTVDIPDGKASVDVAIIPFDDNAVEGDETVIITLDTNAAYDIDEDQNTATVTLKDNEQINVEVTAPAHAGEIDSGTGNVGTFTITATNGSPSLPLTVYYTLTGTATNGTDYETLPLEAVIPAGGTSVDIYLTPIDDVLVEGTETVILTLSTNTAYTITAAKKSVTLNLTEDDIPEVSITATDESGLEPAAAAGTATDKLVYRISRDGPTTADLDVIVALSAGLGTDFTASFGASNTAIAASPATVRIPAGKSFVDITVTPKGDTLYEGPEAVTLTLNDDAAYAISSDYDAAVGTIKDEDLPTITIAASDPNATEDGAGAVANATYTITRSFGAMADFSALPALSVVFAMTGSGTYSTDYSLACADGFTAGAKNITVVIPAGAASTTVTLTMLTDNTIEGTETALATLAASAATYKLGTAKAATVNLLDNDLPTITITAPTATTNEGSRTAGVFRITSDTVLKVPLTIKLATDTTLVGRATSGTDYVTLPTSVVLPAGKSSVDVPLKAKDDLDLELNEPVKLDLAAGNYTIGGANTATVTIKDTDMPVIKVTSTDVAAAEEGTATGTFTITRSHPRVSDFSTFEALTVKLAMAGTGTLTTDYAMADGAANPVTNTVVIPAGAASVTVTLTPVNDGACEGTEAATLTLVAGTGYAINAKLASKTVEIADNDLPTVTIAASDATATEGNADTGKFTITRTGPTSTAMIVNYVINGASTATASGAGADILTLLGTATIPAGKSSVDVTVTTKDDTTAEAAETLRVDLAAGSYTIGGANTATVTIADNDKPSVSVTATDAAASEVAAATGTFRVSRVGGDQTQDLVVSISLGGSARGAGTAKDYTRTFNRTITIPGGQDHVDVVITPTDDLLLEGPETVVLKAVANKASPYVVDAAESAATMTIADEEVPTVRAVKLKDANEATGAVGKFRIWRTGPTVGGALTVDLDFSTGTALGGQYTISDGTNPITDSVVIPAGRSYIDLLITPVNNSVRNGDVTVILVISAGTGYTPAGAGGDTATMSLIDS